MNKKDIYTELQKDIAPATFSPMKASDYFLEQNIISDKNQYNGTPINKIKKNDRLRRN